MGNLVNRLSLLNVKQVTTRDKKARQLLNPTTPLNVLPYYIQHGLVGRYTIIVLDLANGVVGLIYSKIVCVCRFMQTV